MSSLPATADCLFLTGPTASGKTSVGIEWAQRIGAEIVSMDSMALYRGMDIGTAKPTPQERSRAPHHLIDILDPCEEFSLADYVDRATEAVERIRDAGREPIFVGGTPLYLKALLRSVFVGPPADWPFRRRLAEEARQRGPHWLHQKLAAVDPQAAERLHANDTRRIIRALEVHANTGRPISQWQQQFDRSRPASECRVFLLDWPGEELNRRIDRRVDAMFAAGLVAEVERLLVRGGELGRTASQAVGYREVREHLAGRRELDETIALVKTRTRQFAKRQRTWFRSLSECRPVEVSRAESPEEVAARILAQF